MYGWSIALTPEHFECYVTETYPSDLRGGLVGRDWEELMTRNRTQSTHEMHSFITAPPSPVSEDSSRSRSKHTQTLQQESPLRAEDTLLLRHSSELVDALERGVA